MGIDRAIRLVHSAPYSTNEEILRAYAVLHDSGVLGHLGEKYLKQWAVLVDSGEFSQYEKWFMI